jgi:hypothetical protein
MFLNDQKVCIRPTFNRSFYVNEKPVENTTLLAVGSSNAGGQAVVGFFSSFEKDLVFSSP